MSILVKDVDMPERCAKCFLKSICDKRIYMERRPEYCPLIELPPHGRLIDASALEREISKWIPHTDKYINKRNSDFLYYIKDTPTVIEADYPPSVPLEQVWTELFGEESE